MVDAGVREPIPLPTALSCVSELIESRPEAFLTGDEATHAATLKATKFAFDLSLEREKHGLSPIADLVHCIEPSTGPETRSQRKRKRSPSPPLPRIDEKVWCATPLESLHLEGMDDDQVWAQLELRAGALCEMLKAVLEESAEKEETGDDDGSGVEDEDELESLDEDDLEDLDGSEGDDQNAADIEGDNGFEEEVTDLRDPSEEGSEGGSEDESGLDLDRPTRPSLRKWRGGTSVESGMHRREHPILDDGFFSLADFNAETEEAEAKDVSKGRLGRDDEEEEEEDDAEDDVNLFAAVDEVGRDTFEEDDLEEGGEPYYKDFFAPPLLKSISAAISKQKELVPNTGGKTNKVRFHDEVRVKKIKRRGKGNPVPSIKGILFEEEDDDVDVELMPEELDDENDDLTDEDGSSDPDGREYNKLAGGGGSRDTIERLKDDLFAEDDEKLPRDLSTHEARQAEITAQIAKFEAKNVGPKEWTLLGEATSRSRPVNSLLEEDLDFERVMKVVPTVTEEQVSSIEEIIKKRIIDNHFDDVVRKLPADDKPFLPSRFFELNDQKSGQSLAQIYEDEYSAANSGNGGDDDRDGKLKKEHEELAKLWDTICYKLDALSNAHFTPKQPKVTISTTRNVSATSLESALPTTKSVASMLAPEEIFAAPSEIRSREELTPMEKRAYRNKQRKARRKARRRITASVDKFSQMHKAGASVAAAKEKEKALRHVVKTGKGITLVGKMISPLKRQNKEKGGATAPTNGKPFKL